MSKIKNMWMQMHDVTGTGRVRKNRLQEEKRRDRCTDKRQMYG